MVIYRAGAVLGFECERAWCGSSPARLLAPLTPAARSRRRRAAYQSKDHEEAVLQVWNTSANSEDHVRQLASCRRVWMWMQTSLSSDLADEREHVERVGLGQVVRDRAVHGRQAPAPASSNHVACA